MRGCSGVADALKSVPTESGFTTRPGLASTEKCRSPPRKLRFSQPATPCTSTLAPHLGAHAPLEGPQIGPRDMEDDGDDRGALPRLGELRHGLDRAEDTQVAQRVLGRLDPIGGVRMPLLDVDGLEELVSGSSP